jgi:hypothetical protein
VSVLRDERGSPLGLFRLRTPTFVQL